MKFKDCGAGSELIGAQQAWKSGKFILAVCENAIRLYKVDLWITQIPPELVVEPFSADILTEAFGAILAELETLPDDANWSTVSQKMESAIRAVQEGSTWKNWIRSNMTEAKRIAAAMDERLSDIIEKKDKNRREKRSSTVSANTKKSRAPQTSSKCSRRRK